MGRAWAPVVRMRATSVAQVSQMARGLPKGKGFIGARALATTWSRRTGPLLRGCIRLDPLRANQIGVVAEALGAEESTTRGVVIGQEVWFLVLLEFLVRFQKPDF